MFRWVMPVAALTGALVLSACGAEEPAESTATTGATTSEEETLATTPAEDATSPAAATAEYTPQGTELALGDKAVVPFRAGAEEGLVGVTITGIDKGAPADLAPLELGAQADGLVPYYIRITVTNETGGDWGGTSLVSLTGLLADGSEAGGVFSVPASFAPCGKGSAGDDFVTVGASYDTCTLALAADSAEVAGVAYEVDTYADAAPEGAEADYATAPITWK